MISKSRALRYEVGLAAEPPTVMDHRCAMLRKAKAAGFVEVERSGSTHDYRYENVDCAKTLLELTSKVIKKLPRGQSSNRSSRNPPAYDPMRIAITIPT